MPQPPASAGEAEDASPIARERTGLPPPSAGFWSLSLAAAAAAGVTALLLASRDPAAARTVEAAALGSWPWWAWSLDGLRLASAAATALAVLGSAFAARRLLHSEPGALLAAGMVALDPLTLAFGHAAYPAAVESALGLGAVATLASLRSSLRWVGGTLLAVLAAVQPSALLWSVPLALMVVLRGHVYAAPAHVLHALGQCIAVPAAGAAAGALLRASLEGGAGIHACLAPDRIPLLALRHVVDLGGGLVAMPNPITWLAGALVALGVGLLAVVSVLTRFRLQRLPGRLQIRLPGSLPTYQARGAWILLLAATAPTAPLMLALLAIALANGILGLSDDAPGFGVAISLAALAFAVSFLVRAWDLAAGTADAAAITDALNIVPWSELHACATGAPGIAAAPPASAA